MRGLDKGFVILDGTIAVRELYDRTKHIRREGELAIVARHDLDALWNHTGMNHGQRRGENLLIHEDRVRTSFHLLAAACTMEHRHGLRCGCSLVKQ